jgi:hypothetical protein
LNAFCNCFGFHIRFIRVVDASSIEGCLEMRVYCGDPREACFEGGIQDAGVFPTAMTQRRQ